MGDDIHIDIRAAETGSDSATSTTPGGLAPMLLMANFQVSGNLVWEAQIRQVALPGWEGGWDLTPEQEAHVLKVLFELLDTFLAERDGAASGS
ncbi:hypothetical protein EH183_41875 [Streptomyces sp. CB01881]|uniref:hypothetical protein n=1 Tax=Streptomyces sp. CB01881 TaxID=2078691 RepID=UPI0011DFCAC8|nr:hypothetical protein [Streptomyces sp. CB01881]TYC66547.1 hypothetical protein EH183_41875 [Streptomyces sp. CB01881]